MTFAAKWSMIGAPASQVYAFGGKDLPAAGQNRSLTKNIAAGTKGFRPLRNIFCKLFM
jgi:hypothetical protein